MSKTVKALISWVPANKGGRRQPPIGPSYKTCVRFDEDPSWPDEAWTLVVDFIRSYGDGQYLYAKVYFLMPDAPDKFLHAGSRFQLYEGRRLVATGLVREGDVAPNEPAEFESTLLH